MLLVTRDGIEVQPQLLDNPSWTRVDGQGDATASVSCMLPEGIDVRGAQARLDLVVPWFGFLIEEPKPGQPVNLIGWPTVGTRGRRQATYVETDSTKWKARTSHDCSQAWNLANAGGVLQWSYLNGALWSNPGNHGFYIDVGATTTATVAGTSANISSGGGGHYQLYVYTGVDHDPGSPLGNGEEIDWTYQHEYTSSGAFSLTIGPTTAFRYILLQVQQPASGGPAGSNFAFASVTAPVVYGTAVTSPTTTNVLLDILANEIDPLYVNGTGAIQADATLCGQLAYALSNANPKIDTLQTLTSYRFGWYARLMGGRRVPMPHWEPIPTTPSYILDMADATQSDLAISSFSDLYSAVDVSWTDPNGVAQVTRLYDSDPTHRLVQLGMNTAATAIVGAVPAQVSNVADATAVGNLALADKGRDQLKGSATWMVMRDEYGNRIKASEMRPNKAALVFGLDAPTLARVVEVDGTGDATAKVSLDNSAYALDIELAQLSNR